MNTRLWIALLRIARRKAIGADLVERRRKAEEQRRLAFHSPPLTPEEFEAGLARVEAERRRQ